MPTISHETIRNDQVESSLGWFAIYVQSRQERVVASSLINKGFETCLPLTTRLRQWSDRCKHIEEPVFPGYLFCKFDPNLRTPILRTAGVVQILGAGRQVIPLEPEEIDSVRALERAKVPVESCPYVNKGELAYMNKGERVYIMDGPLQGLSGIIANYKNSLRVIVSVALLQRSVAVEVNTSQIRPIESAGSAHIAC